MTIHPYEPYRYVLDKFYGVEYAINLITNECAIRRISKYSQNPDGPFDFALYSISKFVETGNFLQASNAQFIYHGDRKANQINGQKFNANITSNIYEYTFSDVNIYRFSYIFIDSKYF